MNVIQSILGVLAICGSAGGSYYSSRRELDSHDVYAIRKLKEATALAVGAAGPHGHLVAVKPLRLRHRVLGPARRYDGTAFVGADPLGARDGGAVLIARTV